MTTSETKLEFSGRLTAIPPSDLFQWARNDRRTGALVLRRSSREKRLFFVSGDLVGATSDDPAEFYGQYLLLNGHVGEEELVQALTYCAEKGKRLGSALVELNLLGVEQVRKTLHDHIQDLTLDVFLWDRGLFFFEAGEAPKEDIVPEPVDSLFVAMEGSRWLDEYRRIRRVFPHDEVVLARRPGAVEPPGLTPLEAWIFQKVNGERTLAKLHAAIGGAYFRFLEAALRLSVSELLDIEAVAERVDSRTRELSLQDLLADQARERVSSRHDDGVPIRLLETMYPMWIGEALPGAQKENFFTRCDGTRMLKQALSPHDRKGDLDLFFVALSRGVIALLPAPVRDLEQVADERKTPPEKRWWRRVLPSGRG